MCYAILCHAMPCHAVLCYAMLCYAMLNLIVIPRTGVVCELIADEVRSTESE